MNLTRSWYAALIVGAALLVLDRTLEPDDARHSALSGLRTQAQRLQQKSDAQVVTLGSSTIGLWLGSKELARVLGRHPREVLDGSFSACYAGCSWAVARRLLAEGRHFESAFVGVNLFSMCEGPAPLRVMPVIELAPLRDTPEVLSAYAFAQRPSVYWGTWAGMAVSRAYRDVTYIQDRAAIWAFGKRSEPDEWRLATDASQIAKNTKQKDENKTCKYGPEEVALQTQFWRLLLQDLEQLADHTYLLSLPERALAGQHDSPKLQQQFATHRRAVDDILKQNPHATLIDMTQGGIDKKKFFRDPVHLNAAGVKHQSKQLARLLKQLQ